MYVDVKLGSSKSTRRVAVCVCSGSCRARVNHNTIINTSTARTPIIHIEPTTKNQLLLPYVHAYLHKHQHLH